jgi:hypothetical protein
MAATMRVNAGEETNVSPETAGAGRTPMANTICGACGMSHAMRHCPPREVCWPADLSFRCSGHSPGRCDPAGQQSWVPAASTVVVTCAMGLRAQHADTGTANSSASCSAERASANEASRRRKARIERGEAILRESYDARKTLTGSVKGGVASGSQNPRIIPDFLASRRPTRVVPDGLQDSCSEVPSWRGPA